MAARIMFLMPEFPSHTHTWLWREICGLRANGLEIVLASTRRPKPSDYAKHDFASEVKGKVFYAWPPSLMDIMTFMLGFLPLHPRTLIRCVKYLRSLQADNGPSVHKTIPLLVAAWRLSRACRSMDICHIHVATPANSIIVSQLACIIFPMTCDVTVNANLRWWGGGLNAKFDRCSRIFVVAQWMKNEIERDFPPKISKKTYVARHGVDTNRWKPKAKKLNTTDSTGIRIVSVGRLHPAKGHADLIKSVQLLNLDGHKTHLRIVGGGPDLKRLKHLVHSLNASKYIELCGPLNETSVRKLIQESDLFVLASHSEALGVVYMEAMSCGLPVIGTDVGGIPEIIVPHLNGLLVPAKDPKALADSIRDLIVDPMLRDNLAGNARAHVIEHFDSSIGAKIVSDEIKKVLGNQYYSNNE